MRARFPIAAILLTATLTVSAEDSASPDGSLPAGRILDRGFIESNQQPGSGTTATSLDELEAIVLSSHPTILIARRQVTAAQGQYLQAGLRYNPVLQYQSDEIGNDGASGLHSVQLSQQFVTANKLGIARQVEAQRIARLRADLRIAELQVLTNLRRIYADTLVAQQRVVLAGAMSDLAKKSVDSVETLFAAEEVSKVSLLQARVELEQASIAAEVAATDLAAQRRRLAAAAGIDALAEVPVAGDLDDGLVDRPWESLLADIYAASPNLAAAGSELERARWALQHACAKAVPDITGTVGVGIDAATDDTYARIGISVPLPIHNRNQGNIRTARAELHQAHALVDQTRLTLQARLATVLGRYQTARQRYLRLQIQILPNAQETFDLSQQAFQAGESSYLQLLAAQRTLINTRLQILDAIAQARQAMAEIDGILVTAAQ